jgi:hypothetical protein
VAPTSSSFASSGVAFLELLTSYASSRISLTSFDSEAFNEAMHRLFGYPSSDTAPSRSICHSELRGLETLIAALSPDDQFLPLRWLSVLQLHLPSTDAIGDSGPTQSNGDHPPLQRRLECPECLSTHTNPSMYMTHLRKSHSAAPSLVPFEVPGLPDHLCRCPRCHWICCGRQGLRRHQGQSKSCKSLRTGQSTFPSTDVASSTVGPGALPLDDDSLLALFTSGLFVVHRKWTDSLFLIMEKLLSIVLLNHSSYASTASLALLILPGLVDTHHRFRKTPILQLLNGFAAEISHPHDGHLPLIILANAQSLAPIILAKNSDHSSNSSTSADVAIPRLSRRADRFVRERRLRTAMQTTEVIQDFLDADLSPEGQGSTRSVTYDVGTVRSILSSLCPAASSADSLTEEQLADIARSTPLTITPNQALFALEHSSDGAAAGASGWTFAAMKAIFLRNSSYRDRAGDLLSRFCNLMLSGKLHSRLWLRSRSVFIPKKDGQPRPLGIGDAWYRFVGRAALSQVSRRVGHALAPLQLGIGFGNGCDIGGRTAQMVFDSPDENLVLISLDNHNAFNTLSRRLMCSGLATYAPELLRWFQYSYGEPSPLYFQGVLVAHMSTGCKQGDNFGSFLYAVGFQATLISINASIQRHIEASAAGCSLTGGVYAYIDDTTVFVDAKIADLVATDIKEMFASTGITLATTKCRFLVPPKTVCPAGGLTSFVVESNGSLILGCPVGTSAYRQHHADRLVRDAGRSLPALSHLSSWSAISLLRQCISPRVAYLARVSELHDNLSAFQIFDEMIDTTIQAVGGISRSEFLHGGYARVLRSLPLALNGLGIPRFAGLAGETACLLSREHTYNFLEEYYPSLLSCAESKWPKIPMGRLEDAWIYSNWSSDSTPPCSSALADEGLFLASGEFAMPIDGADSATSLTDRRESRLLLRLDPLAAVSRSNARALQRNIHLRRATDLISALHSHGLNSRAVWCKSSFFKGSGSWLSGPGGPFYGRFSFRSSREYILALRMRLLLPPASSDVGVNGSVMCSCNEIINISEAPFHCLDCPSSQFHFIHRHNAVRDSLHETISSQLCNHMQILSVLPPEPLVVAPSDPLSPDELAAEATSHNASIQLGPRQSVSEFARTRALERNSGKTRADACVVALYGRQYIDVAIANPAAHSYSPLPSFSSDGTVVPPQPGSSIAIPTRIAEKRRRYRPVLGDLVDSFDHFVPFVVEATGHLSDEALRFVQLLFRDDPSKTSLHTFCRQLGGAIARYNAMAAHSWVLHLRQHSSGLT